MKQVIGCLALFTVFLGSFAVIAVRSSEAQTVEQRQMQELLELQRQEIQQREEMLRYMREQRRIREQRETEKYFKTPDVSPMFEPAFDYLEEGK